MTVDWNYFWGWIKETVPWLLEKPAQGFAWLINCAPKTALVVAVAIAVKAVWF